MIKTQMMMNDNTVADSDRPRGQVMQQQTQPGSRSQKRPQLRPTNPTDSGAIRASSCEKREMDIRIESNGSIIASASGLEAIHAGTAVLNAHIRSQARLKFGLYALASLFVIASSTLVVFSPAGRETISYIISFALFAVAVGCAGFSTFAIKTPVLSARAKSEYS
jgi:hypothetical protein